jgi:hypothetical protein
MGSPGSRITCAVRSLGSVTSQIFRCHGLQAISERADRLGCHDLAYWLIFVAVLCAWFLFLFVPQRQRLTNLSERQQVLCAQLKAEKRELVRLERSIKDLTRGDPQAWERAARGKLGWLQPGEVTDIVAWNQTHNIRPVIQRLDDGAHGAPTLPTPSLRQPRVPPLPIAPLGLGSAKPAIARESINPDLLGLMRGTPPPLPPRIQVPPSPNHGAMTLAQAPAVPHHPVQVLVSHNAHNVTR